jgi:hypothetical protein
MPGLVQVLKRGLSWRFLRWTKPLCLNALFETYVPGTPDPIAGWIEGDNQNPAFVAISRQSQAEGDPACAPRRPGFLKEKPDLGTGRAQLDGPTVLGKLADNFQNVAEIR